MFPAICWVVFSIATALNNQVVKIDHNTVESLSADGRGEDLECHLRENTINNFRHVFRQCGLCLNVFKLLTHHFLSFAVVTPPEIEG